MDTPSASEPRPKRRWTFGRFIIMFFLYLWAVLLLVVIGVGVLAFVIHDHITQPGSPGPEISVIIPAGASGQRVAEILHDEGLVAHPSFFTWAMRLDDSDRPIIQGSYALPRGLSPTQLLQLLQEGPERDRFRVTIPEGLAIPQMAELFDDPEAFLEAASDPELIERLEIEAETLEGFLMPNTYFFDAEYTEREVVERMVAQFELEYALLLERFPEAAERDKLELITIASLIEEEARAHEERPLVAAVIYNRLETDMPLQMDSTLQFALQKYGQRMLNADKEVDSPYNTYMHRGLPPGPISSPGLASIEAALTPAEVDYLYFVSNADGRTHTFSVTYAEHQRAVAEFRRLSAIQRAAMREDVEDAEDATNTQ